MEDALNTNESNTTTPTVVEGAAPAPVEEQTFRWYVLKVTSNREKSIRDNLWRRIRREGVEQQFRDIRIPTQKVAETKGGKKKVTEEKLFPGYLMIEMILNDETWTLVRGTSGVGDFTGASGKPLPMQESEIARILGQAVEKSEEQVRVKISFSPGDTVRIRDGSFVGFTGRVDSVDDTNGRVTVLVEIFGRPTPVEDLEHWQIEAV